MTGKLLVYLVWTVAVGIVLDPRAVGTRRRRDYTLQLSLVATVPLVFGPLTLRAWTTLQLHR